MALGLRYKQIPRKKEDYNTVTGWSQCLSLI
jgi:hypothetical protein